jgi:hypothetical protein
MPESGRFPDRFYVDKKDIELYEKLKGESFFKKRDNKDLFLMAMVYGHKADARQKLSSREGYVRAEYLKPRDWALINAICLSIEGTDVLGDGEKMFSTVEECAHGGIQLLVGELNAIQYGSYDKHFEKKILDLLGEIGLG